MEEVGPVLHHSGIAQYDLAVGERYLKKIKRNSWIYCFVSS